MALPNPKIEIGFDLTDSPIAPFFRLDDNEAGRLDNTEYRLGGTIFYDVTDRVRSVNLGRGRPNLFTNFPAAQTNIEFNNHDRAFDPLYEDSPFFGNIVPRREVRISANEERIFTGWIEDWGLDYTPDGNSTVTATAYDAFYILAGQTLEGFTPDVETADERINTILSRPGVAWAGELRNLEASSQNMGAYEIPAETNALQYMQKVAESEPGGFFVDREGNVAFTNRSKAPTSAELVEFCCQNNIPFDNLRVEYGAEKLYNEVVITRQTGGTAIASDLTSQSAYGVRTLDITDLLVETDEQIVDVAVEYASRFSDPEYRFDSLEVSIHKLDESQQNQVLGLELGSICSVTFMPNSIPPAIERYVEVINIEHTITPETHYVTFGFSDLTYAPLVLDDTVFGKLDVGTLSW